MIDLAVLDDLRKQLQDRTNQKDSLKVIIGIEKMKGKFLKEKNVHLRQILAHQELEMDDNNEILEKMYHAENKLLDATDELFGPYGQGFQLELINSLWNKKTASDEKFLKDREQQLKIAKEYIKTLPYAKKVEEIERKCEQNQVKIKELQKKGMEKEKLRKKLETNLAYRQEIANLFINARKKLLTDIEESNTVLEEMLNRPQTSMSNESVESEIVQEVAPIPVVPPVPVEPINQPTGLQKMEMPKFNFDAFVFPRRSKESMCYRPLSQYMAPLRTLPVSTEDLQRQSQIQQPKRKSTDGFVDDSKSTKHPKTHHSEEMSGDNDDRRKSLTDGNKENVLQQGERQRESRAAGPSSAQDDRQGLMAQIQRNDNRSAPKNDKQRDALQLSSDAVTSSRSNMVQPVPQRSSAFVAYGSQQKLPSSSLLPEDRSKMPQQTGRVSDHRQQPMYSDGRKSSSRRDDEATMNYNSVGRGKHGQTSPAKRSTVPQQTGRKRDPNIMRHNEYAIENYGRYQSTQGDGRKSAGSRQKATMPYPGQKPEMRESIAPADQRGGHGSAGTIMYDDRQNQQLDVHREVTRASFNRDEKMDGQRVPKQLNEHVLAPNAPSKHQTEREYRGDRESGRKSDSSLIRTLEQRKFKTNPGHGDDTQRCHGNDVASGSGGAIQPEFLVPTTKTADIKQKMDNKRMEQSKSDVRVSPTPSAISSVRSQFSYGASEGTDLGNMNFDDDDFDFDLDFDNKTTYSHTPSGTNSAGMRSNSDYGDNEDFGDWGMDKFKDKLSPLSDFPDFPTTEERDEVPAGFENY